MIKAAIFDMDGTFLDSMPYWLSVGNILLTNLKITPEKNLGEKLLSMTMDEGALYLIKKYNLPYSLNEISEMINEILKDLYKNTILPKEDAIEFIKDLKKSGTKIAVCTNTDRLLFWPAFLRLNLSSLFDIVLTTKEFGSSKETPEIFFHLAKNLGTKPEETWVFEDALYSIKTATNANFKTAGIFDKSSQKDKNEIQKIATKYFLNYNEIKSFFLQETK